MQLKKGQIIDLEIESIAFGGAGVGHYEGMAVFVGRTMPGDKVKAAFTKLKKQYAEADLVELIEPASERQDPKCRYFGVCGGCQLQFMPYGQQLEIKKQQVVDAFERIGGFKDLEVNDVIGCDQQYYYRNKMEFSFGYDAEMNFTLGMHVPGRRFDIMDLEECHLQSELSFTIVNAVREFMRAKKWPPFKYSCGEGFLKHLCIRESENVEELMINLVTSDDLPDDFMESLSAFVEMLRALSPKITSIYWSQVISRRGHKRQTVEKVLYGEKVLREKLLLDNGDELVFDILPQAFFQVNTAQAEILYSQALRCLGERTHEIAFDLFCGTGTIGLFLAKHCKQVFGIEINESAVQVARDNAAKNNIFNIDFYVGDVAKMVSTIKERPSLIVIDPPRAGITEKTVSYLNEFGPEQIVYVSCNPATQARDCAWLKEYGYTIKKVQPVDMFPQTFHIENIVLLER